MDAGRLPVDTFVLHHAVTQHFKNYSDAQIREIFSNFGRAIYNSYGITPYSHINPSTGGITYTQAHMALHEYDADGNKYGWRIVDLIEDMEKKLLWHAANGDINARSLGLETCIDARYEVLPEKALMLIADRLRPLDQRLGGGLKLFGHSQVSQTGTQCPAQLLGQLPTIIDMINNPDKWNAKLWPAPAKPTPAPTPAPAPAPEPAKSQYTKFVSPIKRLIKSDGVSLWDLNAKTWADFKAVKTFKKGEEFIAVGVAQHPLGGSYYMTASSFGKADETGVPAYNRGVNEKDLVEVPPEPAPSPTPQPTPATPTPEPTPTPTPTPSTPATPSRDNEQDARIGALEAALGGLFILMQGIGAAIAEFLKLKK